MRQCVKKQRKMIFGCESHFFFTVLGTRSCAYVGCARLQPMIKKLSQRDTMSLHRFLERLIDPGKHQDTSAYSLKLQNALMSHSMPSEMSVGDTATASIPNVDRLGDQDGIDLDDSDFTDTEDVDDAEDQFPMELDDNDTDTLDTLVDDLEMNLRRDNASARSVLETDEPFVTVDDTGDQSNSSTLEDLSISEDDVLFLQETISWELSECSFLMISSHIRRRNE